MFKVARLIISSLVAFVFYASWAYYANSLVTDQPAILYKAALVQGSYSALITFIFTYLIEHFHSKYAANGFCLCFIMPRWSTDSPDDPCKTKRTMQDAVRAINKRCQGAHIPGMLLAPLPALAIQTVLVTLVNVVFATPNLFLTVAPSILFSALYGYSYSIGLSKAQKHTETTADNLDM
ncbi:hypothetical protein PN836_009845 [Ningiella sp. W23]|uniref:hypothetical protein n=1 Tax=Ningiella sp. W23 TaxID=3023715 RepID=UPI00375647FC